MAKSNENRQKARLAIVKEHVRFENLHDLEGILKTFGDVVAYEDQARRSEYPGVEGIRSYYEQLLKVSSDLRIDIKQEHVSNAAVILEVMISGTHTGDWDGLPSTGGRFEFPLCAVYTFDDHDKLAGERIYYDRTTIMNQIGVFREPVGYLGRAAMMLNHPLTIARAYTRKLLNR